MRVDTAWHDNNTYIVGAQDSVACWMVQHKVG